MNTECILLYTYISIYAFYAVTVHKVNYATCTYISIDVYALLVLDVLHNIILTSVQYDTSITYVHDMYVHIDIIAEYSMILYCT
jgi:hypothetical protein